MVECMKRGWKVSLPIGEDCRYDVIVDTPKGLTRVQIKALSPDKLGRLRLKAVYGNRVAKSYTIKDCDIIAGYAISLSTWWIIPVKYLQTKMLNLNRKYHEFNSAWHLIGYNEQPKKKK